MSYLPVEISFAKTNVDVSNGKHVACNGSYKI